MKTVQFIEKGKIQTAHLEFNYAAPMRQILKILDSIPHNIKTRIYVMYPHVIILGFPEQSETF